MVLQELQLTFPEFAIPIFLFALIASFLFSCIGITKLNLTAVSHQEVHSYGTQKEVCTSDDIESQKGVDKSDERKHERDQESCCDYIMNLLAGRSSENAVIKIPSYKTLKHEESKRDENLAKSVKDEAAESSNDNPLRSLRENRKRHLEMERTEKRTLYIKTNQVTEKEIPTWDLDPKNIYPGKTIRCKIDEEINKKISVWKGDITRLEIDAVVNAANLHLGGGGGVDKKIHEAAGPELLKENQGLLKKCPTGEARVAAGYKLPAYYIIHTNGPQDGSHKMLARCYLNCLSEVIENKIRTVAFPGISTGAYGFPIWEATHVAAKTVREWLDHNKEHVDRIIFCVYLEEAEETAYKIFPEYFPN